MMGSVRYEHWSGAGNTFAIIDARPAKRLRLPTAELARRVCATGPVSPAGIDGLLLADGARVRLWNRDGSTAGFCGNGSRCYAAHMLRRTGAKRVALRFGWHAIEGWREGRGYTVGVPAPRALAHPTRAQLRAALAPILGEIERVMLVRAGVPHLCLLLRRAPVRDLTALAARLRRHPRLGARGANVTFLWMREGARRLPEAEIRTFERGVEGFTAACGSGAVAGARLLLAAPKRGSRGVPRGCVRLRVASGAWLRVEHNGPAWTLSGPARRIGEGVIVL
jgi:diaminopimelate epimerase